LGQKLTKTNTKMMSKTDKISECRITVYFICKYPSSYRRNFSRAQCM